MAGNSEIWGRTRAQRVLLLCRGITARCLKGELQIVVTPSSGAATKWFEYLIGPSGSNEEDGVEDRENATRDDCKATMKSSER